jgi:cell wall-associated NlpC family hydrolase
MSEFAQYIGKPWVAGGTGPEEFDCWGLLTHVAREHFGRKLPGIMGLTEDERREAYRRGLEGGLWRLVEHPQHGDAVLLRGGSSPHVGVYLDIDGGGVLHALEGVGVIFSRRVVLPTQGYGRVQFYRL